MSIEQQNQYLDYLIDIGFQEINILSVLSFENKNDRKAHTGSFLPKAEIKDDNFMIDERNFFDYPIKSDQITYDNIRKIANGCSLNYLYFKEHYKLILMDLRKQALDAYPKAMQQTGFAENLEQDGNTQMSFIIVEAKKNILYFSKRAVEELVNGTEVTLSFILSLNLSSNVVGDSNDGTSFPHKYLLTITQVSSIRKAFTNSSSANKKSSKPPKMVHL